jgi:hypothetical protein
LRGVEVPDAVPPEWRLTVENSTGVIVPPTLRDAPDAFPRIPAEGAAAGTNRQTVGAIRQRVLPLVTGWGMAF